MGRRGDRGAGWGFLLPVGLLFLLSGAAGLLYEVLWSRQLARVLGGSYPAVVAVLAAFLGGLALGAALGGRLAHRVRRPLRAYGLLEAGIAIWCAAFPLLLAGLHPAFGWCYRHLAETPSLHTAARFLLAGSVLLPPTVAMGATLPLLVRAVVRPGTASILGGTGFLYGLNTVGAAGGAWATGFLLLPALGFTGTLWVGVGTNLLVGAAALLLDRRLPPPPHAAAAPAAVPAPGGGAGEAPGPRARRVLLVVAFGGGFASMLYQLGWTRALVLCFGSSVQAFTLVVSTFILGLGVGGLLAPLARSRGAGLLGLLVLVEAVVGVAGWSSVVQVAALPVAVAEFLGGGAPEYGEVLRWETLRTLGIAFLPTCAMGAAFPLLVACTGAAGGTAERAVGRVYAAGTLGILAGALGGGLLLIPSLGTRDAVTGAAMGNLALAALAATLLPPRRGIPAAAALAALAAAVPFVAPEWPPHRMHSGPYLYAGNYASVAAESGLPLDRVMRDTHWNLPFAAEGRSSTVAVVGAADGSLFLRVNGKTDASTVEDIDTQNLVGHVPMLAHPDPRRVMVVGLASGMTAAAAAAHGPEVLDVAEISREVRDAERFFRPWNGNVTERPGVRVLLEDGRTHLEHSGETYDVVISEPTNPWIAGVSDLFTVEYFRALRERLAPGGVACVWLQAYGLSDGDFRLVLRTFREVFPAVSVWETAPWQDYLLVAPRDGGEGVLPHLATRPWPSGEAAAGLAAVGIRSREDLLALLFLDPAGAAAVAGGGELHTDDRLQLEFGAPRRVLGGGKGALDPDAIEALRRTFPPAIPPGPDRERLRGSLEARALGREGALTLRAATEEERGNRVLARILEDREGLAALLPEVPAGTRAVMERAIRDQAPPRGQTEGAGAALIRTRALVLSRAAREAGLREAWAENALGKALLQRGTRSLDEGFPAEAAEDFRRLGEVQPWNAMAPYLESFARIHVIGGAGSPRERLEEALRLADRAVTLNPRGEAGRVQRAKVLAALGRVPEAKGTLLEVLRIREDSVRALGALAELLLGEGRREEARALVERGLRYEPGSTVLLGLEARLDRGR